MVYIKIIISIIVVVLTAVILMVTFVSLSNNGGDNNNATTVSVPRYNPIYKDNTAIVDSDQDPFINQKSDASFQQSSSYMITVEHMYNSSETVFFSTETGRNVSVTFLSPFLDNMVYTFKTPMSSDYQDVNWLVANNQMIVSKETVYGVPSMICIFTGSIGAGLLYVQGHSLVSMVAANHTKVYSMINFYIKGSTIIMNVDSFSPSYKIGDSVTLSAFLTSTVNAGGVSNDVQVTSGTAIVYYPNSTTVLNTYSMVQDPLKSQLTMSFLPPIEGNWLIQVEVQGKDVTTGTVFFRAMTMIVAVFTPVVQTIGNAHLYQLESGDFQASVQLLSDSYFKKNSTVLMVSMQIYGTDYNNQLVPIVALSGLADLDDNLFVSKRFHNEWVNKTGTTAPFVFKHVKIYSANAQPVASSSSPNTFHYNIRHQAVAEPIGVTFDTLTHNMKQVPVQTDVLHEMSRQHMIQQGYTQKTENNNNSQPKMKTQAVVGYRFLVHGYCTTGSESWTSTVTSRIQNARVWSYPGDPGSFSVSAQASNLLAYMNSVAGVAGTGRCGILAHSQGGHVSAYIWSFYASCLDTVGVSQNPYKIITLSSPWGGTNLAGVLGSIGSFFGTGCGSNSDLTYSGAKALTNQLSVTYNQNVYSFTASSDVADSCGLTCGKVNCCSNAVSNGILSDPNDGITELSSQQWATSQSRGVKLLGNNVPYPGNCYGTSMQCGTGTGWSSIAKCYWAHWYDVCKTCAAKPSFPNYQCHTDGSFNYPGIKTDLNRLAWIDANLAS